MNSNTDKGIIIPIKIGNFNIQKYDLFIYKSTQNGYVLALNTPDNKNYGPHDFAIAYTYTCVEWRNGKHKCFPDIVIQRAWRQGFFNDDGTIDFYWTVCHYSLIKLEKSKDYKLNKLNW